MNFLRFGFRLNFIAFDSEKGIDLKDFHMKQFKTINKIWNNKIKLSTIIIHDLDN